MWFEGRCMNKSKFSPPPDLILVHNAKSSRKVPVASGMSNPPQHYPNRPARRISEEEEKRVDSLTSDIDSLLTEE